MRFIFALCIGLISLSLQAQKDTANLVLNPSFELLSGDSVQKVGDVTQARSWMSATARPASLFTSSGTFIYDPYGSLWPFKARTGINVAGINVFGGTDQEPVREYLQGTLSRPLTVGRKYYFSFYVHYHCEGANNIGIAFVPDPLETRRPGLLNLKPATHQKAVTRFLTGSRTWTLVRDSFVAYKPFRNFVIGNFFPNAQTSVESEKYNHYFAFIDDIAVVEAPDLPQQESNSPADDWSFNEKAAGQKPPVPEGALVVLFGFDSAVLTNEEKAKLDSLSGAVKTRPELKLSISGHASSEGTDPYNQRLSEKRVRAVLDYLSKKGIRKNRIRSNSFGEKRPATGNDTPEGRASNRRVEVVVAE